MQNRYFGDIGDFGKYGMLRLLINNDLKLGVNWYLYPDEHHNKDGKHIRYLKNDADNLSLCDKELYDFLKEVISSDHLNLSRNVSIIEKSGLLKDTLFYRKELSLPYSSNKMVREALRKSWYDASLEAMAPVEVIFCDPDNGLQIDSVSSTARKGGKFILYEEVKKYYQSGKSLIVYNHGPLWFGTGEMPLYIGKLFRKLTVCLGSEVSIACMKWGTTSKRFYFWIMKPEHEKKMRDCVDILTKEPWGRHFERVH
jgi:hypothetical protein